MNTIPPSTAVDISQEVTRFGRELGIDLQLDETGNCYLEHRNGLRIAIMLTGDDQIVTAVALFSDVHLTDSQVGEILTEFNWLGTRVHGATLSWNPEARNFLLWYSRDANVIKTEDLGRLLTRLLSAANMVRPEIEDRISNAGKGALEKTADSNAPVNWMARRA